MRPEPFASCIEATDHNPPSFHARGSLIANVSEYDTFTQQGIKKNQWKFDIDLVSTADIVAFVDDDACLLHPFLPAVSWDHAELTCEMPVEMPEGSIPAPVEEVGRLNTRYIAHATVEMFDHCMLLAFNMVPRALPACPYASYCVLTLLCPSDEHREFHGGYI